MLKKIDPRNLKVNPFTLMEHEWFLLTAGKKGDYNTMTCGWGALGYLWNKPIAVVFVRPTRHTYKYANKYDEFTLSFFGRKCRKALSICGSRSGRDCDKVKEAGLTLGFTAQGNVYFQEARMVLECRKIYFDDLDPKKFLSSEIGESYPKNDYHRFYVGEIRNIFTSA
jgi:flavin reductase (DIM6/NTAB) family NADH-FMN oxidoreductase RutF